MTSSPSFRDVEQLSAYLDGQLKPSERARLKARLQREPELASVLQDLRQARGILRQLPRRRAPRNFILTPKMVGLKPPMPRAYPVFRLATVLATLLLFFTFATNFMAPRMARTAAPYGIGGYGGGEGAELEMPVEAAPEEFAEPAAPAPAMEAPAATEAPAAPQMPAPAPTAGAAVAADSARIEPTPQPPAGEILQGAPAEEPYAQKTAPDESLQVQPPPPPPTKPIGGAMQIVLVGIAILSALITFILRYTAIRKWRAKAR